VSSAFGTGRADVSLLGGAFTPCLHWKILRACPTVFFARYLAKGLEAAPRTDTAFFASAGLKAGVEIPIAPRAWGFLSAEGLVNLTRHELLLGEVQIWKVPPFAFTLSAGAVVSIL
jgi:hypothetical protein